MSLAFWDKAAVEQMDRVLDEVALERHRQERKGIDHRARGQEHWRSCADPLLPIERKLAILGEEYGEVAKALNEEWIGNPANLREELIHVAAVAVAWAESLTSPVGGPPHDPVCGTLGAAENASEGVLACRAHRHTYGTDHGRSDPRCVYCGESMAL